MFIFYLLLISVELITSKCNTFFNTICFFNEMPFGVPTFWISSLLVVELLPIRSKCTAQ